MTTKVETILCIPGMWNSRTELLEAIIKHSGGYMFAGLLLMHLESKQGFQMQVESPDPQLYEAFEIANQYAFGGVTVSPELLEQIEGHKQVLYLIAETGNIEAIHALIDASIGLLNAGGLAVKVESTGVAYSAEKWRSYQSADKRNLFDAFVTIIFENETMSSVGMHNLGLRDAFVSNVTDPRAVQMTIATFLLYTLIESPELGNGHTFSVAVDAPVYRLQQEPCSTYPNDSLFHNPYGMWHLQRTQ